MTTAEITASWMDSDHGRQQRRTRSRRAQYVNQACNECKRRKVKCNGVQPCSRCVSLSVTCSYPESRAHCPHTQRRTLSTLMTSTSESQQPPASSHHETGDARGQPAYATESATRPKAQLRSNDSVDLTSDTQLNDSPASHAATESPEFCGPSSSEYTLNVVSGNLKALGIPSAILDRASSLEDNERHAIFPSAHYGPLMKLLTTDPLCDWKKLDAISLINSWCAGVGSLYPVICAPQMIAAAHQIFACLEHAQRDGLKLKAALVAEALFNDETNKIKAVLAIGRTLESGGRNDQAQRLFQSITEAVESLMWNSGGIDGIQLLVLVAIYHYHLDDEVRAGRIIGFAARLCLELGLHRREMVERLFPTAEKRDMALKTFWSVYMFERRTSLGQGTPFSIQDSHVDPSLFALDTSDSILSAMLEWTKLAGKVWQALNTQAEKGVEIKREDLDYLDFQINKWYDQLPDHLKLDRNNLPNQQLPPHNIYHQAIFFIRKSHLRNLIHRPVLQNSSRIISHERYALQGSRIARESIQTLSELHTHTALITSHALFFKHLLLTAFGNLLLAVVNAPSKFWNAVKEEFDMALDLIRLLSARSGPLMRLWRRLEGLQELQTKLFQPPNSQHTEDGGPRYSTGKDGRRLRFEHLFPPFPSDPMHESATTSLGGFEMREQVNSLFDVIAGPDSFFDFFDEWGTAGAAVPDDRPTE